VGIASGIWEAAMSSMPRKPAQVWAIFRIRVQGPGEKKAYKIEDSHPGSLECGDKSPLSIIATCRAGLREAQPKQGYETSPSFPTGKWLAASELSVSTERAGAMHALHERFRTSPIPLEPRVSCSRL